MRLVYSSVERAKPANTSKEELVTPPRTGSATTDGDRIRYLTLVGTRVLKEDNFALLEVEASLLREEEIGTLNHVFEVGLALLIEERIHVGDVDGLRSTTTGNEEIGLEPQVSTVTEISSIQHDFAG
jgi:hypothetical protein